MTTRNVSAILGLGEIKHLGCVVEDLDHAMADRQKYDSTLDWRGWVYGPDYLAWQKVRGESKEFAARIAVSGGAVPQLELIQPLSGESSWARALEAGDGTLHHIGFVVEDFWSELSRLEAVGFEVMELAGGHGLDGDGALAYLDTWAAIGTYIEIIQPPARRAAPHFVVDANPTPRIQAFGDA